MAFVAVPYDESAFYELYPQFQGACPEQAGYLSSVQAEMLWQQAVSIVGNSETNAVVPYDPESGIYQRRIVLYALMCHLATIALQNQLGQSGTIASASEGSVSVSFAIPTIQGGGIAQWYNQTPCGRMVWAIMRKYASGPRYYGIKYYHPYG